MGLFAFYGTTVHSQLLTIYLDVIVCNIIKEKNMNVLFVGSDAVLMESNREVTLVPVHYIFSTFNDCTF